jgi:hypothetical protein
MLQIKLEEDETIISEAQAAHVIPTLMIPKPHPGIVYITNKRVVFSPTQGRLHSEFEYPLKDIESFSVGMLNTLTLTTKEGKTHKITGMFNKKLIEGLTQVGINKI